MQQALLAQALGEARVAGGLDATSAPDVVKSAARVFKIMELFDVLRREASVSEIAELLEFPQSSTSVLLHSMADMGYLSYDRETRAFAPTLKVALLGNWVSRPLVGEGQLIQVLNKLNVDTGLTAVLATRNRIYAEYIHVVRARDASSCIISGSRVPLIASAAGLALIADLPDPEIRRLVIRINSETLASIQPESHIEVLRRIEEVRVQKHAFLSDPHQGGTAMIALRLGGDARCNRMAVGVSGCADDLGARRDALLATVRESLLHLQRPPERGPCGLSVNTLSANERRQLQLQD